MLNQTLEYLKKYFQECKNFDDEKKLKRKTQEQKIIEYIEKVLEFFSTHEEEYNNIFSDSLEYEPHYHIEFIRKIILKELAYDFSMNKYMQGSKNLVTNCFKDEFCYLHVEKACEALNLNKDELLKEMEELVFTHLIDFKKDGRDNFFKFKE